MAKKIIHVNRAHIALNAKWGEAILPTYIVRYKGKATYAHAVKVKGDIELVDPRTHNRLACGARAWMTTDGEVETIDPMTYQEALQLKEAYLETRD